MSIAYDSPIFVIAHHHFYSNPNKRLTTNLSSILHTTNFIVIFISKKIHYFFDRILTLYQFFITIKLSPPVNNHSLTIELLSNDDKIAILKKLSIKLDEKIKYINHFGGIGLSTTAFVSRKLLKSVGENTKAKSKEKQTDYDIFDKQMIARDPTIVPEMLEQFRNYVQNKK
jgi:hypothetical protein